MTTSPRVWQLSEVHSSSVLPRGADGTALVRLPVACEVEVAGTLTACAAGTVIPLPTGGPHRLRPLDDAGPPVEDVLVGDVWVLAGQSNMQGSASGAPAREALPGARVRGLDARWRPSAEPLHRLYSSMDLLHLRVHRRIAWRGREDVFEAEVPSWCAQDAATPLGGRGPGYAFADEMVRATGVPVGLLACALGGSSLEDWEPRDDLYEFLVRAVRDSGPVRGVLWYQGESDAKPGPAARYAQRFGALVASVRRDVDAPGLPFLTVQLASVDPPRVRALGADLPDDDVREWTVVREAQRRVASAVPGVHLVSAVDLEVHDGIHLDAAGADRVGRRLGQLAVRLLADEPAGGPDVVSAQLAADGHSIALRATRVTGRLRLVGPCDLRVLPDGPAVQRVTVEPPDVVRLHLAAACPPGRVVTYAEGACPQAGLVDDADLPLPAFGPLVLTETKQ